MGKTRDLLKKFTIRRDTKGTCHAKKGSIKNRNCMDLTEAEDNKIIRRGGKNTQNNYTIKDLHDPDIHNGMIIYQEPDILERESSGP